MKSLFCTLIIFVAVGCNTLPSFKKREDGASVIGVNDTPEMKALRLQNANLKAKLLDYEEQFRLKSGSVEELEMTLKGIQEKNKQTSGEKGEEIKAYQDSIAELIADKKKLQTEVLLLKNKEQDVKKAVKKAKQTPDEHLDKADALFDDNKWAEAIASYQMYREKSKNKKSKEYALVTYKIGVCFQELNMISEAKTFYKSVVSKYKGTRAHSFASFRLTKLDEKKKK